MIPNKNISKANNVNISRFIKYFEKQLSINSITSSDKDLSISIIL